MRKTTFRHQPDVERRNSENKKVSKKILITNLAEDIKSYNFYLQLFLAFGVSYELRHRIAIVKPLR